MSALNGIRVVELAAEPIAFAGKLMADMGADVILVEPPGGDPSRKYPPFLDDLPGEDRSLYWWHYHTSKKGIVLDLTDASGREDFRQLIRSADVLIEAESPNTLGDFGIDYPQLQEIRPELIHVAMTPYGRENPKSLVPATDLTILAGGGPVWSCGYDDHSLPPVRGSGNQGYHIGCHFAVMSALTAILHRGLTGTGQFVDVSMHAAANVTTEAGSYAWLVAGVTMERQTGRHQSSVASMETQALCSDGRYANTGVLPRFPDEFSKLLNWLRELGLEEEFPEAIFLEMGANWGRPFDLADIGIDETLTAIFVAGREALVFIASRMPAYEFFTAGQKAGLSVGAVNAPEEAFEDPHIKARGFQVEVEHPDLERTIRYPGAPIQFEKTPWQIRCPAPKLGQHTDEVLKELNRS